VHIARRIACRASPSATRPSRSEAVTTAAPPATARDHGQRLNSYEHWWAIPTMPLLWFSAADRAAPHRATEICNVVAYRRVRRVHQYVGRSGKACAFVPAADAERRRPSGRTTIEGLAIRLAVIPCSRHGSRKTYRKLRVLPVRTDHRRCRSPAASSPNRATEDIATISNLCRCGTYPRIRRCDPAYASETLQASKK